MQWAIVSAARRNLPLAGNKQKRTIPADCFPPRFHRLQRLITRKGSGLDPIADAFPDRSRAQPSAAERSRLHYFLLSLFRRTRVRLRGSHITCMISSIDWSFEKLKRQRFAILHCFILFIARYERIASRKAGLNNTVNRPVQHIQHTLYSRIHLCYVSCTLHCRVNWRNRLISTYYLWPVWIYTIASI